MLQKSLTIYRHFTTAGKDPLDEVKYVYRDIIIKDQKGHEIYRLEQGEFPEFWSDNACRIVASKYFSRNPKNRETSVRQLIGRVVERLREFALRDGYLDEEGAQIFRDELAFLLVNQWGCFNSPVWFNLGLYEPGTEQTSACFVLPLEDTMESLLKCQRDEVMIAKNGSGSGVVNSKVRSSKDIMSRGGRPSGPLSFMKARDAWANIILSGGVLRRFAKMEILHYWHPDIEDFVSVKAVEEEKARRLGPDYHPWFQNSNFSVRVDDVFWEKYKNDEEILCYDRYGKKVLHRYRARDLLRKIAEGTYNCGDPGLQYEDTMYKWITVKGDPTDIITNPCSEYIWYPNTSCNLASLNLMKFVDSEGKINHADLQQAVNIFILGQDLLVHTSGYPTKEIYDNTVKYRNLGLGFSNLGATLMRQGLPYDSDEARQFAKEFMSHIQYYALKQSLQLARELGPAEGYDPEKYEEYLHLAAEHLDPESHLYEQWMALIEEVKTTGLRNCQLTVLAPTGTISFMMDCETTGIEPVLFLKQVKNVVDGYRMEITTPSVEFGLRKLGYPEKDIQEIMQYVLEKGTIEGCDLVKEKDIPVFDTSFSATRGGRCHRPEAHIDMCAAVQPFVSGGISKTVNLPNEITVEEIEKLYLRAYEKGLKCVAMYRDGSKVRQVLEKPDEQKKEKKKPAPRFGERKKLPDTCDAKRHKFVVGGHSGFLHYSTYPDTQQIGEIFLTMSREGSTLGGLLDCFAASISIGLQYGVPIEEYIRKFINTRFVPSGYTDNKEIPRASSIVDYVFRYLALQLGHQDLVGVVEQTHSGGNKPVEKSSSSQSFGNGDEKVLDGPPCDVCGSMTYVSGRCYVCSNCGTTTGCG